MATYLVGSEIDIIRQEGDTSDIVFTVPDILDLSTFTEIKFQVKNGGSSQFSKSLLVGTITVDLQTITINLLAADTKSKAGQHRWELEISNVSQVITIGRGNITIIREMIV